LFDFNTILENGQYLSKIILSDWLAAKPPANHLEN
jgi:hypothetical protein